MGSFFNHYSFIWIALALTILAGLALLTNKPRPIHWVSFVVIVAGLVSAWFVLHPRQTPRLSDASSVQALIGAGRPVLLEFQSPY